MLTRAVPTACEGCERSGGHLSGRRARCSVCRSLLHVCCMPIGYESCKRCLGEVERDIHDERAFVLDELSALHETTNLAPNAWLEALDILEPLWRRSQEIADSRIADDGDALELE